MRFKWRDEEIMNRLRGASLCVEKLELKNGHPNCAICAFRDRTVAAPFGVMRCGAIGYKPCEDVYASNSCIELYERKRDEGEE